jgi:hypothetical protein
MRAFSVLGVVVAGVAIGATAVLAPLMSRSAPTGSLPTGWMAGLSGSAAELVGAIGQTFRSVKQTASPPLPRDPTTQAAANSDDAVVDTGSASVASGPALLSGPVAARRPDKSADPVGTSAPWQTRVAIATEGAPVRKQTSSKPVGDEARADLVRDIQRELKRVGCYSGDADGQWGGASKRAISAFTERVNASLPVEDPDFILLTLVQGHKGLACGAACPSGQTMASQGSAQGRCVPNAVLAHGDRSPAERAAGERAKMAQLPAQPKDQTAKDPVAARVQGSGSSVVAVGGAWSAKVIPEPGSLPSDVVNAPTFAARGDVKPLPGRMTIGGPIASPPPTTTAGAATAGALPSDAKSSSTFTAGGQPPSTRAKGMAAVEGTDGLGQTPFAAPASVAVPVPVVPAPGVLPKSTPAAETPVKPRTATALPGSDTIGASTSELSRTKPANRAVTADPAPAARLQRRPDPVVVQRPPRVARYVAPTYLQGPSYNTNSSSARSRRLVYDLFQRPDR